MVVDACTGFLTPPGDADALARRVGELVDDPQLRQKMGGEGRALVERRFDILHNAEDFVAVLDRARHREG